MNRAGAWTIADASRRTRDAAVEAARRAGMGLDDWLDEAVAGQAGLNSSGEPDESEGDRLDAAAHRLERIARRQAPAEAAPAPQVPGAVDLAIERFGTRLARAEARAARAFESVARILDRDTAARDGDRRTLIDAVRRLEAIRADLSLGAPALDRKPPFDFKAAAPPAALGRHELEASRGRGDPSAGPLPEDSIGLGEASNARRGGAEAAARTPPAQLLGDDIRALAAKVDDMRRDRAQGMASTVDLGAMRAEIDAMERSLADLAPRNAIVALEGAIRDLVQRVEMLRRDGQAESMLAPLEAMAAEFRAAVKAHDPQAAAARLEREIRAIGGKIDSLAATAIDPEAFERIRRQTEGVRDLLASAALRTAPIERLERQIGNLADRVERLGASPVPHFESAEMAALLAEACRQIERSTPPAALASIERRLEEIATRLDREIPIAASTSLDPGLLEALARREADLEAVAHRVETINDRIDQLAAKAAAGDPGPVLRELIERLREADKAEGASAIETSAVVHAALDAHLTELKAEQASADRRTQSHLADLKGVLETLTARLASIETELVADDVDEPASSAPPASSTPRTDAFGPQAAPQREAQPGARIESSQPAEDEDLLIEPGAGSPQRAREARELAQPAGPRTNPAVSIHIAAARRAAQAALAEQSGAPTAGVVKAPSTPFSPRGAQAARAFHASRKRTVLFCVAIAIATTLATRMGGVHAPFLHRSELDGQAVDTASGGEPGGEAIDAAPTGSIAAPPVKPDARDLAPEGGPSASALPLTIPPGIPASLRDAVAAGEPNAQYELAMRLADGLGMTRDQTAAARWFERAALAGLAPAQYRLGAMYEKGIGVSRDPAAAKGWYLKAAKAGNARAAHNLAVMDADPSLGPANYPAAEKWFRKAADLGLRDSQYNLAILYARGLGVEKDLGQAFLWFSLAARQGDQEAARKRDEIVGQMDPASFASAVEALMKFKPAKLDPAANEVAAPAGGWNARPSGLGRSPVDAARP